MTHDPQAVEVLTTVASEVEAAALAAALEAQGIHVRVVGGFVAGFRAEAPADVQLLVLHADLDRARLALAALRDIDEHDDEHDAGPVDDALDEPADGDAD